MAGEKKKGGRSGCRVVGRTLAFIWPNPRGGPWDNSPCLLSLDVAKPNCLDLTYFDGRFWGFSGTRKKTQRHIHPRHPNLFNLSTARMWTICLRLEMWWCLTVPSGCVPRTKQWGGGNSQGCPYARWKWRIVLYFIWLWDFLFFPLPSSFSSIALPCLFLSPWVCKMSRGQIQWVISAFYYARHRCVYLVLTAESSMYL